MYDRHRLRGARSSDSPDPARPALSKFGGALQNRTMSETSLVKSFRLQAGGCRLFGSDLYAELMDRCLEDVLTGGPVFRLLEGFDEDPVRGFLPLRLLGAIHARVLAGEEPRLAQFYPSVGGRADAERAWPFFVAVIEANDAWLRGRLGRFPQTNEVRRCGGLVGGFLEAAHWSGLPLRLREIGCSAGLNLQWHRYHYTLGRGTWGEAGSPVELAPEWNGATPRVDVRPEIESRAGCDLDPPRLASDDAMRMLESFVWADQPDRLDLLRAAIGIARTDPPRVEQARARDWLPIELEEPALGVCTVLYHSSLWLYITPGEQTEIREMLEARGQRATQRDPLVWLRVEDGKVPGSFEIRYRAWPGGEEQLLGMGHPHGRFVDWHG
jgi:hypothetical protein